MKLAPHLHRIGNDIVAAYLVETPDGHHGDRRGAAAATGRTCRPSSRTMGRSIDDVRGLILTHGDTDHLGFAERLRRDHGVPVYVHADDAERAKGVKQPKADGPKNDLGPMRLGATLGFFAYALRKGGMRTDYLTEVVEVADGDVLPLPGSPVIIGLPGHSPGSIAIHVPVADAVFVGDALTTRHVLTGRTGGQPAPFTDEPAASARLAQPHRGSRGGVGAARSWRAVARLTPRPRRGGAQRGSLRTGPRAGGRSPPHGPRRAIRGISRPRGPPSRLRD